MLSLLYSSALSSTSSVSPSMAFTALTASPTFSLMVSITLKVASPAGAAVVASGAALVTMDSGLGTPSMPISSVSKTASAFCQLVHVIGMDPPPSK